MTAQEILFAEIKKILKYSGREVENVSLTEDGIVADFKVRGQLFRMFLCKKNLLQEKIDYSPA